MFKKLFLVVIVIHFLKISQSVCEVEDDEHKRPLRDDSIFSSFLNWLSDIKRFFGLKKQMIQEKKKRVKNAIQLFLQEIKKQSDPIKSKVEHENHRRLGKPINNSNNYMNEKNAEQMITEHGYRSESHTVLTNDGYILTIYRVVRSLDRHQKKRAVILHHGLLGSAEDWLLLGPTRALPYILTDNGYDVWLLNARGNKYSRIHTDRPMDLQDFWDFSWHEIGVYDLPAAIKYISEVTGKAEINFIGHSMGATALLVMLATLPEYNYILRSGILLAPIAFMYHAKGPIRMLANFYRANGQNALNFLGTTEFMPHDVFPEQIVDKYCKGDERMCSNSLLLLANGGRESLSEKIIEDILHYLPAGGSVKTLIHYVQLVRSGYFQWFDYGASDNMKKYGNNTPPLYNLRQISLPLTLFSSPSDWLATVADIQTLLPLLQDVKIHHVVKADDFGHLDFVWSLDAPELVFDFIISILDQILPKQDLFFQD